MKKSDITIGMVFYTPKIDHRGRQTNEIKQVTVTSVGNKYFEISTGAKISIDNLKHEDKNYPQLDYQLYLTANEITDMWELNEIKHFVKEFFIYGSESKWWTRGKKLSLDQLRRIRDIISENNPPGDQ
jgi:hypothetical protein